MEPDCDTKQLNILSLSVGGLTDDRPEVSLAVRGSALKSQHITTTTSTTSSKSLIHIPCDKDYILIIYSHITEDSLHFDECSSTH